MRVHGTARLIDQELRSFFDWLFPHGFAGPDVVSEIAPEGWERSPLLACFHPSVERVFEEQLKMRRRIEELSRPGASRRGRKRSGRARTRGPTLAQVRREYQPQPVRQHQEITELVGMCLWDVFSDNHEVLAADGRLIDLGSWRGSSAFLDEYVHDYRDSFREADDMRFYMGSAWIDGRADLAPVYCLIFSRLKGLGADWVYRFPELYLVEIHGRAMEGLRNELAEIHTEAREEAMDRLPPATVRAYRQVYGRDPSGWPPA